MPLDDTGVLSLDPGIPDQTAQADPTAPQGADLVPIPLTPEQITEWRQRITESRDQRKQVEVKWDILMKEYLPVVTDGAEDVRAGIHFRNVHSKKSKLFIREPDLILTAEGPLKDQVVDPMTGTPLTAEDAVAVKQAVLNKKLGRKGINARRMVGECLFDILAWAGLGCTKISYRNVTKPVQEPRMVLDPTWVPPLPSPSMLGLAPTPQPPMIQATDPMGQPAFDTIDVVIWEEWDWRRFSPKKLLLPAELRSCRFDEESAWLGSEMFLPVNVARAIFKIPPEVELKTAASDDDRVYQHDVAKPNKIKDLVHIVEIFYKASIFDPSEPHPQAIRQLVLVEGDNERAYVHRPSPDQTFDEMGKLTPDSMIGFPIHIFTNRDLADSPWVFADNAFTNSSVKHINTHRRQSVQLRDANIPKFMYDVGAFTPEEVERLRKGKVGDWIEVQEGRLAQGSDKIIAPVVKSEASRDDWRVAQTLKQDVEETLGIGGTNAGSNEDTVRTATEISTSASALADRLSEEQDRILDIFLCGVEKFDALLQRYADDADYVELVGKDGMRRLAAWNKKTIAGRWAYTAKPDSQLRIDAPRDRAQTLALLKEVAPFNGVMLDVKPLLRKLATQFGFDPSEFILPDMPPPMSGAAPGAVPGAAPTGALPNAPSPGAGTPEMIQNREQGR